jgi:hypothetical protein
MSQADSKSITNTAVAESTAVPAQSASKVGDVYDSGLILIKCPRARKTKKSTSDTKIKYLANADWGKFESDGYSAVFVESTADIGTSIRYAESILGKTKFEAIAAVDGMGDKTSKSLYESLEYTAEVLKTLAFFVEAATTRLLAAGCSIHVLKNKNAKQKRARATAT